MKQVIPVLCIKCKKQIDDGDLYCRYCGKKQSAAPRSAKKTHNPNGTGTVYKRGSTWTAKVRVKRNGVLVSTVTKGGFATRAEAINYLPNLRAGKDGGSVSRTVDQLFSLVQAGKKWNEITPDKRSHYLTAYKRLDPIKDRDVAGLRYSELQNLIDGIDGAFYPKRDAKTILQKIFDMAVLENVIPPGRENIVSFIELPSKPLAAKDARTPQEMRAIWADWQNGQPSIAGYALLMAYTGMRTGELFAQDVSRIDLSSRCITGGIKTAAGRDRQIPVSEAVAPVLEALLPRARYGLVDCDENSFYSAWKQMIQRTGIRPLGSYCQRHTCYTRLHEITPAVSEVVINSIMGHSNSRTKSSLADNYGHISLAAKLHAVNSMKMI